MDSVTLRDVAKEARVSISTVSRVMRNYEYVGEKTKKKVLEAIKQLNYAPNTAARRLKYGRTYTIGFILPDISNPFFSNAIKAAYTYIKGSEYPQYELLFYNTDGLPERERKAIDFFLARQLEGIIIASSASDSIVDHIGGILQESKTIFVSVDNHLGDLDIDLVTTDNYLGAYKLTSHLLDLGHESIAVISGPSKESSSVERLEGYQAALKARGVELNTRVMKVGAWTKESGMKVTEELLDLDSPPTAIFGFNNSMSLGALSILKKRGINVPHQMALVSFNDVEYGDLLNPALTCTSSSWYELGRISAKLLLDRILNQDEKPAQCIKLPIDVIIRESCGYK